MSCPTKLYYRKMAYPSESNQDPYLEMLAEGGFVIEKMAKLMFPEGVEIGFEKDHTANFRQTIEALDSDEVTLFEATLIHGSKLARVDILRKRSGAFDLIEVKAKSYNSQEAAQLVANGYPSYFQTQAAAIRSEWREYLEDITFQVLVLSELFPGTKIHPFLMMPDTSQATRLDGLHRMFPIHRLESSDSRQTQTRVDFLGNVETIRSDHFLTTVSVEQEVALLMREVRDKAQEYATSLQPKLLKLRAPISVRCRDCEYRVDAETERSGFKECWGPLAESKPHLLELFHVGTLGSNGAPIANELIQQGKAGLLDVPEERLVKSDGTMGERNKRQLIQIQNTRNATEWLSGELKDILESFQYPLHFIDFETATMAVPCYARMRPYEVIAFQWSCHTLQRPGAQAEHQEWINALDEFPNFEFARTLKNCVGNKGTVFMWANHEKAILESILRQAEERGSKDAGLLSWLEEMTLPGRLVDMNQLAIRHYFHPLMKGRTSIKVVCDAIWKSNQSLRSEFSEYLSVKEGAVESPYASLPPLTINGKDVVVAEGTGAIRAYEAMMFGVERDDSLKVEAWKRLLLQYCRLDTLAMVMVWKHWSEQVDKGQRLHPNW